MQLHLNMCPGASCSRDVHHAMTGVHADIAAVDEAMSVNKDSHGDSTGDVFACIRWSRH